MSVNAEIARTCLEATFLARLNELRTLRRGWLNGSGEAISAPGLEQFANLLQSHFPGDLPLPYLFPTEDGGVRAEWSIGPQDISMDINLDTFESEWHEWNSVRDAEVTAILDLTTREAWQKIASIVRTAEEAAE